MANPLDIACPTCGETAGRYCRVDSAAGSPACESHPERIAASNQPRTAEAKRWIAFTDALEAKATQYESSATATRRNYAGEIGRLASVEDQRRGEIYRDIAAIARRVAGQRKAGQR